jgi:hypothetical protein
LKECEEKDTPFICHKSELAGEEIICKGFYDNMTTKSIEFNKRLVKEFAVDAIKFVDPFELYRKIKERW